MKRASLFWGIRSMTKIGRGGSFSGIVKVQTDDRGWSVMIYSEDFGIHLLLEGRAGRSFMGQRQMKRMSKAYFHAHTDDEGILILGDQVDDQDW